MSIEKFFLENKGLWRRYKGDINRFTKETIIDLIIEDPDIINIIALDKLNEGNIRNILINQPGLIKHLKPYLDKLCGGHIYWILMYQPKLIKDLKPYLDKLDRWGISWIPIEQPKHVECFKPYLHELDRWGISDISDKRPDLSLFFKYRNTEYEDAAYYCTCPSEIFKLDEEEKQELSKKIAELIRKEKR